MHFILYIKKKILRLTFIGLASFIAVITTIALFTRKAPIADAHEDDTIRLPILMYHGLIKSPKHQNRFMIHPDIFESDLKYIKEKGYTTIFVEDLINYVYNDQPLPEKPIMITFDDGYYNNYLYGFPLLKKYGCKIVLSPIGKATDDYSKIKDEHADYSHVTWTHINEMVQSGLVEIQNHTYNLHSNKKSRIGCTKSRSECLEQYKKVLTQDLTKMQERALKETGKEPTAFVYPFGAISKQAPEIVKSLGFKATFCCEGRINNITKDPDCLYHLCRFIRPNSISTARYFAKILKG